ncbi:hypothetical protein [Streptomyces sp. NPDC089915]|uniref:hypothetical protein n=1 Tax=Streptomyces sp. NPDC089915 TaxID=3155186 RepID=UPI0034314684
MMRRRIIGAVVAGGAGLTLALLPLSSASAHDHGGNWNGDWNRSSHSRWADNWDDDDDCGGNGNNWRHNSNWNDHDWGRWDNANWNGDWGGWR